MVIGAVVSVTSVEYPLPRVCVEYPAKYATPTGEVDDVP